MYHVLGDVVTNKMKHCCRVKLGYQGLLTMWDSEGKHGSLVVYHRLLATGNVFFACVFSSELPEMLLEN